MTPAQRRRAEARGLRLIEGRRRPRGIVVALSIGQATIAILVGGLFLAWILTLVADLAGWTT